MVTSTRVLFAANGINKWVRIVGGEKIPNKKTEILCGLDSLETKRWQPRWPKLEQPRVTESSERVNALTTSHAGWPTEDIASKERSQALGEQQSNSLRGEKIRYLVGFSQFLDKSPPQPRLNVTVVLCVTYLRKYENRYPAGFARSGLINIKAKSK